MRHVSRAAFISPFVLFRSIALCWCVLCYWAFSFRCCGRVLAFLCALNALCRFSFMSTNSSSLPLLLPLLAHFPHFYFCACFMSSLLSIACPQIIDLQSSLLFCLFVFCLDWLTCFHMHFLRTVFFSSLSSFLLYIQYIEAPVRSILLASWWLLELHFTQMRFIVSLLYYNHNHNCSRHSKTSQTYVLRICFQSFFYFPFENGGRIGLLFTRRTSRSVSRKIPF